MYDISYKVVFWGRGNGSNFMEALLWGNAGKLCFLLLQEKGSKLKQEKSLLLWALMQETLKKLF